ncbi:Scr1 family TA system antitoxin-like transcriptional regulator [Micromonospora sp. MS34]|uniref:Scr1 family TA system antitoxin-like transcriptional regulator n=1 Tax=Micromonospora sp. MS34 TaxID=3385971 RepID=UPI0039A2D2E4
MPRSWAGRPLPCFDLAGHPWATSCSGRPCAGPAGRSADPWPRRSRGPARFEFLLAEPVLRWLITSPEVMRGQLARLQTVVGVPNIRFGILPLGVPLATTPQNSFQMYDDVAIVETFVGETTYRDDEAATYTRAIERLWQEAVTGEDARRIIVRAAQDLQN